MTTRLKADAIPSLLLGEQFDGVKRLKLDNGMPEEILNINLTVQLDLVSDNTFNRFISFKNLYFSFRYNNQL